MSPSKKEEPHYEGLDHRIRIAAITLITLFVVLGLRFWSVQVLQLSLYAGKAEDNMTFSRTLKADRGMIYGRHDAVLADNRASATIYLVPGEIDPDGRFPEEEELLPICRRLETLLGISSNDLFLLAKKYRSSPFTQHVVKQDVSKQELVSVEEYRHELPGVLTVMQPQRRYPHGTAAGQLLGYMGNIDKEELEAWDSEEEDYDWNDWVGKGGLERKYEPILHGDDGEILVTKYAGAFAQWRTDASGALRVAPRDSKGNMLGEPVWQNDPTPGEALYLTLDIDLQAKCETLLTGTVGAMVVLDAETGAVLALASTPTYDPSVFLNRGNADLIKELLFENKPKRMRNRAYQEVYPPASVFKVMMASAALEEGIITEHTTHFCPGFFKINGKGRPFGCWKKSGHGTVDVVDALAYSCDVFFYKVGLAMADHDSELEFDLINQWGNTLGIGKATGIDLPNEAKGLIPTRAWKKSLYPDKPIWEQRWYPGETLSVSIGQGDNIVTPLQQAVLMAIITNGGYRVQPFLNKAQSPVVSEQLISEKTLRIVRQGMQKCVEKQTFPSGTGRRAYIEGMTILGKTGTAEIGFGKKNKGLEDHEIPYLERDHAWFVCGVVDREPKIAVCVFVEHGLHGSEIAPLAKEAIQFFYDAEAARAPMIAKTEATQPEPDPEG